VHVLVSRPHPECYISHTAWPTMLCIYCMVWVNLRVCGFLTNFWTVSIWSLKTTKPLASFLSIWVCCVSGAVWENTDLSVFFIQHCLASYSTAGCGMHNTAQKILWSTYTNYNKYSYWLIFNDL